MAARRSRCSSPLSGLAADGLGRRRFGDRFGVVVARLMLRIGLGCGIRRTGSVSASESSPPVPVSTGPLTLSRSMTIGWARRVGGSGSSLWPAAAGVRRARWPGPSRRSVSAVGERTPGSGAFSRGVRAAGGGMTGTATGVSPWCGLSARATAAAPLASMPVRPAGGAAGRRGVVQPGVRRRR